MVKKEINKIIRKKQQEIERLVGKDTEIRITERRNPNTASLLFCKSSFANVNVTNKNNQKCNANGCMTCEEMGLPRKIKINNVEIKLDFRKNCKTDNVVYVYICKHCKGNEGHYFGQTTDSMHIRANGHRSCFKNEKEKYTKSALAYHIKKKT